MSFRDARQRFLCQDAKKWETSMTAYFDQSHCDIKEFEAHISRTTETSDVPFATELTKNIPVYDVPNLTPVMRGEKRRDLMAEWAQVLMSGAGVIALRGAYSDTSVLDEATAIYEAIIAEEKEKFGSGGDHFAAAGSNDRVWNALQKLCLTDPALFARYFGNEAIQTASEAWLGPMYQMTAQVNLVHPGGAAQQAHRDYHLGFQTADVAGAFPAHVHDLSPVMTLQGAIAHCDMPLESGPTKLLPFSQSYRPGYMAYRLSAFREVFEQRHVQVALKKGDVVFFNPAVFHAAGENTSSDIHRFANLLQVGSAMGRSIEAVDRTAMCKALYPVLANCSLDPEHKAAAIASCAEGYSFPTNLDTDPPLGGLVPQTQADLFHQALAQNMTPEAFNTALDALDQKRLA